MNGTCVPLYGITQCGTFEADSFSLSITSTRIVNQQIFKSQYLLLNPREYFLASSLYQIKRKEKQNSI